MARQTLFTTITDCDVCGTNIALEDIDSMRLNWEGNDYILDLCDRHLSDFDDTEDYSPFIEVAARVNVVTI